MLTAPSSGDAAEEDDLSKKEREQVEAIAKATAYRSRTAVRAANRVRNLAPRSFAVLNTSINVAKEVGTTLLLVIATLLVLFIIHQLFIWIDQDPEVAFDRGALLFEVAEVTWDTSGIFYNAAIDVLNAGVIPLWNAAAYYVAEPIIILVLEIFSLVFTKQHWGGLFSEADFPYNGLDCLASQKASEWCGRYAAYSAKLEAADKAAGYADTSGTYQAASRRLLGDLYRGDPTARLDGHDAHDDQFVFGIATARRLAVVGDPTATGTFVAPAFEMGDMNSALLDFNMLLIVLGSQLTDVVFGVLGEVLAQVFTLLADGFFGVLRALMFVLKMLISASARALHTALCTSSRARPPPWQSRV